MTSITINVNDTDPGELHLASQFLSVMAKYRAGAFDETNTDEKVVSSDAAATAPEGSATFVAGTGARVTRVRKGRKANLADANPDPVPPAAPATAVAAGTPVQDQSQAAAAATSGAIILNDSAGAPRGSYSTSKDAADALIEVLNASPSRDSLDNILTVNSTGLGQMTKDDADRVTEAYGNGVARLGSTSAPAKTGDALMDMMEEVGGSGKPPANPPANAAKSAAVVPESNASAQARVVTPTADAAPAANASKQTASATAPATATSPSDLFPVCRDLFHALGKRPDVGFVGALRFLKDNFQVDNLKKVPKDKLPEFKAKVEAALNAPAA